MRYTYYLCRTSDPHHFNADPDPAFHLNADPDPASLQCGSKYCSSSRWCESATTGLQASTLSVHGSILSLENSWILTLMRSSFQKQSGSGSETLYLCNTVPVRYQKSVTTTYLWICYLSYSFLFPFVISSISYSIDQLYFCREAKLQFRGVCTEWLLFRSQCMYTLNLPPRVRRRKHDVAYWPKVRPLNYKDPSRNKCGLKLTTESALSLSL